MPFQSTLVQYINDLLGASKTREACRQDTIALIKHLGKNGHKGGHSDPGGRWPPGPPTTGAPPTGWRCSHEHSDRGGSAAVRSGKSAGSRRLTAARGNPSWRRSALRRHEDSDSPYRHPVHGGKPAMNRMAVGGAAGPLGAPAVPMPMAWARQGPP
ncbi:hypothetical protein NDU88_001925 [Pleurodeles waltl]|uniref:Uncharacterized protein n=1 Tax=Pleurodeles waltl TaxID=8319 RepID=A0AAV7Q4H2_PLEWA|nr:hypothetical protein NDU88_001925 [Pleurodeles waltl]